MEQQVCRLCSSAVHVSLPKVQISVAGFAGDVDV
jgi:hypothetical protein